MGLSPFARREHFDQRADNAVRRGELRAFFSFGGGEWAEKIFVNAAEKIARREGVGGSAAGAEAVGARSEPFRPVNQMILE